MAEVPEISLVLVLPELLWKRHLWEADLQPPVTESDFSVMHQPHHKPAVTDTLDLNLSSSIIL